MKLRTDDIVMYRGYPPGTDASDFHNVPEYNLTPDDFGYTWGLGVVDETTPGAVDETLPGGVCIWLGAGMKWWYYADQLTYVGELESRDDIC